MLSAQVVRTGAVLVRGRDSGGRGCRGSRGPCRWSFLTPQHPMATLPGSMGAPGEGWHPGRARGSCCRSQAGGGHDRAGKEDRADVAMTRASNWGISKQLRLQKEIYAAPRKRAVLLSECKNISFHPQMFNIL